MNDRRIHRLAAMVFVAMVGIGSLHAQERKAAEEFPMTVQMQLTAPNVAASRDFLLSLGFTLLEEGGTPDPWALLTDGTIEYHVAQGKRPGIVLGLGADRINLFINRALRKGVKFHQTYQVDEEIQDAKCRDPYDFVLLYFRRVIDETTPRKTPTISHIGSLTELRIPATDVDTALKFYARLGYSEIERTDEKYETATIMVSGLRVTFTENPAHMRPAMIFDAKNYAERLEQMKGLGVEMETLVTDEEETPGETSVVNPDGLSIIVRRKPATKSDD